jgi:hypothetical protein
VALEEVFKGVAAICTDGTGSVSTTWAALATVEAFATGRGAQVGDAPAPATHAPAADPALSLPPVVRMSASGGTATFHQQEVMPIDGFVQMHSMPYAWARAFPTVFQPVFKDGSWSLPGDLTCRSGGSVTGAFLCRIGVTGSCGSPMVILLHITVEGGFHALVCWFHESDTTHQSGEAHQLPTRQ